MTRPVEFVRLTDGRLWHVASSMARTACSRTVDLDLDDDKEPERLEGIVPSGAWVCGRCREALADWLRAVDMAVAADPRGRRTDPLPEVSEELAAQVEEVRVSREAPTSGPAEAVDLVAALKASVEAAKAPRRETEETEAHMTEVPL